MMHCFSLPFHSVLALVLGLKETHGYMYQLLGLERTTFEQMTGRVLVEHYRDRNNSALGNLMKKKKNCEKENPKLSPGFAHVELLLPSAQPADIFTRVSAVILGGNCMTVCAILLKDVKTGL